MTTTPRLTRRQHEIARLVADGLTNGQIAEQLFLERQTVKNHVSAIIQVLGFAGMHDKRWRIMRWINEREEPRG